MASLPASMLAAQVRTVEIKDTKPHWLYCAQAKHCQMGMVAAINPPVDPAKTQCTFAQLAAKAPMNVPGKNVQGDVFTQNDPAPAVCTNVTTNFNVTSTTTSVPTSTTASSSASQSIIAGNSGDIVVLALKDNDTAAGASASNSDFTFQATVPLDNKPFTSNPPNNITTLSLVTANDATTLENIGCSAVVGGKIVGLATASHDADISINGAPVLLTAVQCNVLATGGSSTVSAASVTVSTPLATNMVTMTKSVDCSTATAVAGPSVTGSAGNVIRLAFSNDLDDTTTQQDILLTGYPISLNEVFTSISVVSSSVSNAIFQVEGQWSTPLRDVTSAEPLNVEKNGKGTWVASLTCGVEIVSNDK